MWQQPVPHHESFGSEYDTLIAHRHAAGVRVRHDTRGNATVPGVQRVDAALPFPGARARTVVGLQHSHRQGRGQLCPHHPVVPSDPRTLLTVRFSDTAARAIALYQEFMLPSLNYVFLEMALQRSKIGEMVLDYVIQNSALEAGDHDGDNPAARSGRATHSQCRSAWTRRSSWRWTN